MKDETRFRVAQAVLVLGGYVAIAIVVRVAYWVAGWGAVAGVFGAIGLVVALVWAFGVIEKHGDETAEKPPQMAKKDG